MMKLLTIILLVISSVFYTEPSIKGKVYDDDHNSLDRVKVSLKSESKEYRFKSNKKGEFDISKVDQGTYTISFKKKGFVGISLQNYEIEADSRINLKVQLVISKTVHEGGLTTRPSIKIEDLSQVESDL